MLRMNAVCVLTLCVVKIYNIICGALYAVCGERNLLETTRLAQYWDDQCFKFSCLYIHVYVSQTLYW